MFIYCFPISAMVASKFFTNALYIASVVSFGCFTISRIISGTLASSSITHFRTFIFTEFLEIFLSIQKNQ